MRGEGELEKLIFTTQAFLSKSVHVGGWEVKNIQKSVHVVYEWPLLSHKHK